MLTVYFFDPVPFTSYRQDLFAIAEKSGFTLKGVDNPLESCNQWESMKQYRGDQPDAWLLPLSSCPIGPQDDSVITALSQRQTAPYILSIPKHLHDPGKILQLAFGAEVEADALAWQYLMEVRPDLKRGSNKEAEKAIVLSWPYLDQKEETVSITLNHREFPPPAGSGVWAWVTPTDAADIRRRLRLSHHSEVAQLTNVERELHTLFQQAGIAVAGIYTMYHDQGHIQLWMAWKEGPEENIRRCSLSSTSFLGLVDMAWEKTGLTFDTKISIRP